MRAVCSKGYTSIDQYSLRLGSVSDFTIIGCIGWKAEVFANVIIIIKNMAFYGQKYNA